MDIEEERCMGPVVYAKARKAAVRFPQSGENVYNIKDHMFIALSVIGAMGFIFIKEWRNHGFFI